MIYINVIIKVHFCFLYLYSTYLKQTRHQTCLTACNYYYLISLLLVLY